MTQSLYNLTRRYNKLQLKSAEAQGNQEMSYQKEDDADYEGPVHMNVFGVLAFLVFLSASLYTYSLLFQFLWEHRLIATCLGLSGLLSLRVLVFLEHKPARIS